MKARILYTLLALFCGLTVYAQTASIPSAPAAAAPESSSEALKDLVARDQAVRISTSVTQEGRETDGDRRAMVHRMIVTGELHTGLDYRNASLVMQHGDKPEDYLLAHVLAVIGASKGDKVALWLSAATLDRYLQSIRQPQIYGTQYLKSSSSAAWTQEPCDRALLTDALRQATGVPTRQEQEAQMETLNKQAAKK